MKKWILGAALMLCTVPAVMAQGVYTKEYNDKQLVEKARKWAEKGSWRNGFTAAAPHESVNLTEFYEQYHKNKKQWKALFKWLKNHDLTTMPGGRHPIEGTKMTVSIEDSENGPLETRGSESHRQYIDFQYVVKGVERFAILEQTSSTPIGNYRPDVLHYNYDKSKAKYYDSTPDKFFLFFPSDWHVAKINNDGTDQTIRVIVVKVEFVE